MEPNELKNAICELLDEHKAVDITILNVEHLTVMTDYFVICTAKSVYPIHADTQAMTIAPREIDA